MYRTSIKEGYFRNEIEEDIKKTTSRVSYEGMHGKIPLIFEVF